MYTKKEKGRWGSQNYTRAGRIKYNGPSYQQEEVLRPCQLIIFTYTFIYIDLLVYQVACIC